MKGMANQQSVVFGTCKVELISDNNVSFDWEFSLLPECVSSQLIKEHYYKEVKIPNFLHVVFIWIDWSKTIWC